MLPIKHNKQKLNYNRIKHSNFNNRIRKWDLPLFQQFLDGKVRRGMVPLVFSVALSFKQNFCMKYPNQIQTVEALRSTYVNFDF